MKFKIHSLNQWLQIMVLATIPLQPIIINNIVIVLWAISSFAKPNKQRLKDYSPFFIIPFVIYFLVHAVGILYSPAPIAEAGAKYLENKTSLLVLPLCLLLSQPADTKKAMNFLVAVVTLLCFACLIGAIINNIEYNSFHELNPLSANPWFFSYYLYADSVDLHPTYFSIFILASIMNILGWRNTRPLSLTQWLLALFLAINLTLLMSRLMVALALLYYIIYLVFGLSISATKKVKYLTVGLAIIAITALNPVVQLRINDIVESEESTFSGMNLKFEMWQSLYQDIISENPIVGIGSINQDEHIRQVYKKHDITVAYESNYNSHNQYIEALVHHGIIGLISLLLLYGYYLVLGIKSKNHLLTSVVLLFFLISFTESVLARQKGIVFFSFILPFLAFNHANSSKQEFLK